MKPERLGERAVGKLLSLRKDIKQADPARLRYVFGKVFSEVRLWWTPKPVSARSAGKFRKFRFSKGHAILNPDGIGDSDNRVFDTSYSYSNAGVDGYEPRFEYE